MQFNYNAHHIEYEQICNDDRFPPLYMLVRRVYPYCIWDQNPRRKINEWYIRIIRAELNSIFINIRTSELCETKI